MTPRGTAPPGYVTVAEAARRLGLTYRTVTNRIAKGYLRTETLLHPTVFVPESALAESADRTPGKGHPFHLITPETVTREETS